MTAAELIKVANEFDAKYGSGAQIAMIEELLELRSIHASAEVLVAYGYVHTSEGKYVAEDGSLTMYLCHAKIFDTSNWDESIPVKLTKKVEVC